jgi:hypothetical protein
METYRGIRKALLSNVRTLEVLESQDQQDFCSKVKNEADGTISEEIATR